MRIILFTITFIFSLSSFAENNASKLVQVRGLVKSDGTHTKTCSVSLELVDESSGKSIGLVNAEELERLHCDKEQDFIATVSGVMTPKFLFWGGNLKVNRYEIADEQLPVPHIVAGPTFIKGGFIRSEPRSLNRD